MANIEEYRRRLAFLQVPEPSRSAAGGAKTPDLSELERQLHNLKQEVLRELQSLRTRTGLAGGRSTSPLSRPSVRALWDKEERRKAKQLLHSVEETVKGLLEEEEAPEFAPWIELNQQIDRRLELVRRLREGVGAPAAKSAGTLSSRTGTAAQRPRHGSQCEDDELYATVGQAVLSGKGVAADSRFCPHCGEGVNTSDRFCRSCGHRLT